MDAVEVLRGREYVRVLSDIELCFHIPVLDLADVVHEMAPVADCLPVSLQTPQDEVDPNAY